MKPIRINIYPKRSKYFIPLEIGAAWNVVLGSLGLFNLQLGISLFLNDITPISNIITYRICWLAVLLAGVGYGIVGFVNHKYRFFITLGAIAKIAVFIYFSYLWLDSTATNFAAIVATGDLIWAVYFIYFIMKTKEYGYL